MKQIVIDGRLGKDAVLGTTQSGRQYLRFTLANSTFSKSEGEKTEWFDITTFDDFAIKYKMPALKKGSYAIVTGTWNSKTTVKDGKLYLNHYVNATDINVPNLGGKKETTGNPVGTVDGPTITIPQVPTPQVPTPTVEQRLNTAPTPAQAVAANNVVDDTDDDLPF